MADETPRPSPSWRAPSVLVPSLALFLVTFLVYAATIPHNVWHTDVFGANWISWHLVQAGTPWIDGAAIPEVGDRTDYLLAIVNTDNGHTTFARFPGMVVVALPAYLLLGDDTMSVVPASLTAAFISALSVCLMFGALRRYLSVQQSLFAAAVFAFATPMWTISANLLWPHTLTVLGIAGMAWAASRERWWLTGFFGGVALWGRLHAAFIIAVLGVVLGVRRRDLGLLIRTGVASGTWLVASCAWNRWVYGTWSPLGGYGQSDMAATKDYRYDVPNQLGMWFSADRGILVWTPIVLLLLPALVRSWRDLPDWSRTLLVGGLGYTVVQASMMTFTGGDGFFGYRYGLEFLACATPALALSQSRMGLPARLLAGPVLGLQLLAFGMGALGDNVVIPKSQAWSRNAFVHGLDLMGTAGWVLAALFAGVGLILGLRLVGRAAAPPDGLPSGDPRASGQGASSRHDQLPLGAVRARVDVGGPADVG